MNLRMPPVLWYLVGSIVYLSFGFTEMMGSDLWWHMAGGREMLQQGTLWVRDEWSFSAAGELWHNHEWLSDLIFYGWVRAFGIPSLVVWKWLLLIVTFVLLQRLLFKISGNAAAALLATSAAAFIAAPFLDLRPQLYSLLGTVVLLNLCARRQPRLSELLPLFVVWTNLHGGFIFGLMLLGLQIFPWKEISFRALRQAAVLVLACTAICLLNPDGYRVFAYPLEYALNPDSPYRGLAEWRSPFERGGIVSPLYPYTLLIAAALALLWTLPSMRRSVPFDPTVLAFALLTAAMSTTSRRFIILWAIAFAVLSAPFLAALLRQRYLTLLALPILLVVAAWGFWRLDKVTLNPRIAYHYLTAEYVYPHGLVDVIVKNRLRGKVFAYYNWGGYLHWRTDGALQVFIDGRANTIYDDRTYNEYVSVLAARPGWTEFLTATGADFFLWPRSAGGERQINELLNSGDWSLIYQDVRGVLLARDRAEAPAKVPEQLTLPGGGFYKYLADGFLAMRAGAYEDSLQSVRRAHELRPWDLDGCAWLKRALQANGQITEADGVIQGCRSYFASVYLR